MGKELTSEQSNYDGYNKRSLKNIIGFYNIIISLLPSIKKQPSIIDLGCGPGYFAHEIYKKGYKNYLGIDFSNKIIVKAKEIEKNFEFIVKNLLDNDIVDIYNKYEFFIILEVLEHVTNDFKLISNIPKGKTIIFSVPNFDSKGHVRYFNNINEVINRYKNNFDFLYKSTWATGKNTTNKKFYFKCIKK